MKCPKKKHLLYQTSNLLNNKIYVGVHSTFDVNDGYLGSGLLLRRAVKRYGPSNFTRSVIGIFDEKEYAYRAEREYIAGFGDKSRLYNLAPGGNGGWDYINACVLDKTTRSKMSKGSNNPMWGKTHSQKTLLLMSEAKLGVSIGRQTELHRERIRSTRLMRYELTDGSGMTYVVDDLPKFCNEKGISYKLMSKISRKSGPTRRRGMYREWSCRRLGNEA